MAPQVGFEPTTVRLTAECSTTELLRNNIMFPKTHYHGVYESAWRRPTLTGGNPQLPSALKSLTSVFEFRLAISGESPRQLVRSDPHVPTAHIPVFSLGAFLIFLLLPSLKLVIILCLYIFTKNLRFWQSFF